MSFVPPFQFIGYPLDETGCTWVDRAEDNRKLKRIVDILGEAARMHGCTVELTDERKTSKGMEWAKVAVKRK